MDYNDNDEAQLKMDSLKTPSFLTTCYNLRCTIYCPQTDIHKPMSNLYFVFEI